MRYRGVDLGIGFRADIVVARTLILEVKSVSRIDESHITQLLTYLRMSGIRVGFVLNFNRRMLTQGIRRVTDFSPSQ